MERLKRQPKFGTLPKQSLISAYSLAEYLGVSVESVKDFCQAHGVRYRVVCRKWLIDVDDLIRKEGME